MLRHPLMSGQGAAAHQEPRAFAISSAAANRCTNACAWRGPNLLWRASMALGQIDPARLQGEALRRWYLRSPAQIEEERRQAAQQAHDAFFNSPEHAKAHPRAGDEEPDETGGGPTHWRSPSQVGARQPTLDAAQSGPAPAPTGRPTGGYQLVAASWAPSRDWICRGCHGGSVLPPPTPFTPPRDSGGAPPYRGGDGSSGKNPKQCVVQYENDSNICRWVPGVDARRRCWESAAKREAHCNQTKGEVGYPDLITR